MKKSISLAIIPARAGSKGLKNKNIRLLAGKPLIAYSIEAAVRSGMFDRVFVSTDSSEYADIARTYGAETPVLRPAEISGDSASSWSAVYHALEYYAAEGCDVSVFMLLQPTSPLRTAEDIVAAFNLKNEKKANAVVSVCKPDHSPEWTLPLPENREMNIYHEKFQNMIGRQRLSQQYFRLNGAIYLADVDYYRRVEDVYQEKCFAYEMPAERSFDVDNITDFIICEAMIRYQMQKTNGQDL